MLSSVPTREKKKPKSYKTSILVGFIFVLLIILTGVSSLYYFSTQASPTVIVINETPNDTTDQTSTVKYTKTPDTKDDKKNTTTTSQKSKNKKNSKNTKSQSKKTNDDD